ncbi:M48 family metallopeptidase [Altererythrobacter sp. Z27]|uniref:M48 family metallopeptidase n=1 Tax=Altererythrobacter sp. Z27 TaxID=3461147 RepID=UPI00404451B6
MALIDILAVAGTGFDVEVATRAYLDTLQGPARAQSDAYFEGGYWLIAWGALVAVLVDWLILNFRLSSAFRSLGEIISGRPAVVTWITALLYSLLAFVLLLPWSIYTEFFREKSYGLLDLDFGSWFGEQAITLGVDLIVAPLLVVAVYALIRRAPRSWWAWSTGVVGVFLAFGMLLAPVFVSPLFNDYKEMEQGPLRDRIVAVAAKYEIPAEHIYVFDQSKQHKRISGNVSGLGPTIRISLNDNLLERTSDEEILAVMGHEMGHYKLNHIYVIIAIMLLVIGTSFFAISRIAPALIARFGPRWGVRDLGDPASLPVIGILMTIAFFLATPVLNSLVRWAESNADAFGLEAAREPDGFARVAMRLSEYRKIEPGPIEEMLFFDHPSGATRVRMAMDWKARNAADPQIVVPEAGYLDAE